MLEYLEERNILRDRDFDFKYQPNTEFYELNNSNRIVTSSPKRVAFYFKDGKHATYLKLLYG